MIGIYALIVCSKILSYVKSIQKLNRSILYLVMVSIKMCIIPLITDPFEST
jgi:hypothetical protein